MLGMVHCVNADSNLKSALRSNITGIAANDEGVLFMDASTLTGLILGLAILALALIIGHVPLETLLNPEALLIVFGGTLSATLLGFDRRTLMDAFRALAHSRENATLSLRETAAYVMDVVTFVRDEGILALQPMLNGIELPFFKKGLMLVLDNRSEKLIRESLTTEIETVHREHLEQARVLETAGGYAPTMGIIGAVIGLICTVQSFHDPAHLGQGVASAFSATLYGVALSNLFLLPLAGKLRQRARNEFCQRTLLLEAILSLRAGEHPILIEDRLSAFMTDEPESRPVDAGIKPYATPMGHSANRNAGWDMNMVLPPSAVMDDRFMQVGPGDGARGSRP